MVGSFYISIKIFFKNYFMQLTNTPSFNWKHPELWSFFAGDTGFCFSTLFSYGYIVLLMFTVLVSIATPIDRAISFFRVISIIFSVLTILSLIGITAFLIGTGFYPEGHFSWLTMAGTIMLSIYIIPLLMRPVDFLWNLP